MKRLLIMLIAAGGAASAIAQATKPGYTKDAELSRWVIDLNLLGGLASQDFTTAAKTVNYPNAVNMNTGNLKYKNGYSLGADVQIGFFFGKKRHFGLGTGVMFMQQYGVASLDKFHVEYQATDGAGNIFRQVVNGNVKEDITSTMINIPIMLKYKNRFSKHWGFAAEAGALVNLQMKNAYTTKSSFDYEAIYQFVPNDAGGKTSVYDYSPTPSANDWLITKDEFYRNNPTGNLEDYFSKKRALGYNVGTGMNPGTRTGTKDYTTPSVGLLIQPSFNYFLSDHVALNFGAYYMFQPFKNSAQSDYRVTKGIGDYSSVLNNVTASNNQAYGINIGARFLLGKKREPMNITSIDQRPPSECGLCDGGIVIHGLAPNQPVTVDYSFNGAQASRYSTTVQPDGQVKVENLCAGNYTDIKATIMRRNAEGKPITLTDPKLAISSQKALNPSLKGLCDGSVRLNGLYAGKSVTVNYKMDGKDQASFTGIVNSDKSITMTGLCEGAYTGMVLTCNTCTTNGEDFTLAAPVPVPVPPTPPAVVEERKEKSTVLFDFDRSAIKSEYYSVLNDAIREMKDDEYVYIRLDGHTDIIGTDGYNQKLSERRALAVKNYFVAKGVNPRKIKMYGHGKSQPAQSNSTEEGRRQNRRVVMIRSAR